MDAKISSVATGNFDEILPGIFPEISEDKRRIVPAILGQTIQEEDELNAFGDVYTHTTRVLDFISGGNGLRDDLGIPAQQPVTRESSASGSPEDSEASQSHKGLDPRCPVGMRLGCVD